MQPVAVGQQRRRHEIAFKQLGEEVVGADIGGLAMPESREKIIERCRIRRAIIPSRMENREDG